MALADIATTPSPAVVPTPMLPGTLTARALVFGGVYLALAALSQFLESPTQPFTTVCLQAGLVLAVLLRTETRDWPVFAAVGVTAGAVFDVGLGRPLPLSFVLTASIVIEGLLGAWSIRRWGTRAPHAPTTREMAAMLVLAPGLATLAGGLIGATGIVLADPAHGLTLAWLTWWSGDALGMLLVAPLVIVLRVPLPHKDLRPRVHPAEPVVYLLLVLAWTAAVFTHYWHPELALKYTLVPFAMWAGYRFGIRGAGAVSLGIAVVAVWVTNRTGHSAAPDGLSPLAAATALQVFLLVTTASALVCSTIVLQQLAAAARLKAAGDRLRAIFDGARDAIFIADDSGLILDANAAAQSLTARTRDELVGLHQSALHPPEDADAYRQRFRSFVGISEPAFMDARAFTADGRTVPVEISSSLVHLEDGRPAVVGVFRDVTERLAAEERSRTILRTSMDAFWLVGVDGRVLDVNDMACSMSGYTRQELLTMRVNDLDARESPDDTNDRIRRLLGVEHDRFETSHWRKDKTIIDVEVSTTVLPGGRHLCAFLRDITARKHRERQLRHQDNIMQARLRLLEYAPLHSLEDVLTATLDEVEALTDSRIGFYHFLAEDQVTLTLQAWSTRTLQEMCRAEGKGLHYNVSEAGVWVDCIHERRPVIHNDYASLSHRKGLPDGHAPVSRELVVPVIRNGLIVAVLGVGNKPVPYSDIDTDTVVRLADLAWDIVAHKRTQDELARREAELSAIYDSAPVMLCVMDGDRHVRYVNRAFEEFTGVSGDGARTLRACGVLGCINAWEDPRGCGFGPSCSGCALRRALVETRDTGVSLSGVEHRTTLLMDSGPKDVVLRGSTARLAIDGQPLLLLSLVDVTRERLAEEDLRASRNQLRALSRRLVALREDTSRQIARELHDRVGQNLTAMNLNFSRLREHLPTAATDRAIGGPIDDSFRLLAETMDHVRDVMAELRPPVLEDYGLTAALRWYGGLVSRRSGLDVSVDGDLEPRPPLSIETALFRIAQEAVSNAVRHASATSLRMSVQHVSEGVRLEVIDDGVGFDVTAAPRSGCWGIVTMQERAEAAGGHLTVFSAAGVGTTVSADLPVDGVLGTAVHSGV